MEAKPRRPTPAAAAASASSSSSPTSSASRRKPPLSVVAPPASPSSVRSGSRPGSAAHSPSSSSSSLADATSLPNRRLLYALPASVHFGGFALDQRLAQRVFVHNNSAKPVRLAYSFPSAASVFRASVVGDRKPFLSPGLSEELLVTCAPTAFQYFYDCLQVRCEEVAYASNADAALAGRCLVPLHAYPVVNEVAFPPRMDFGAVPLGVTARRHVDLSCSVPIEFEYELRITQAHAAFSVFPLCGTIPASGAARIEFEFRPLLFATARAEVELRVSQLGFAPLRCTLTGSSASDVVEVSAADDGHDSLGHRPRPRAANRRSPPPPSPQAQAKTPLSPSHAARSGAKSRTREIATAPPEEEKTERVDGVEIPADLTSMASVNFVLTQQPGKLKPKDLKKAIDANRAMRQRQKDEQRQLALAAGGDEPTVDPADTAASEANEVASPAVLSFHVLVREEAAAVQRSTVSRQIREVAFLQELAEIETIEKELEFQSHKVRLGQELLTREQLGVLRTLRDLNALELQRRERERLRGDVATTAFNMCTAPTSDVPWPPRGLLPAHFEPADEPDFKIYRNDLWSRRRRIVQRLVRAISAVMARNRAQRRLLKIQKWLGNARTKAQVKDKVALEWQQHALRGSATTTTPQQRRSQAHTTTAAATTSSAGPLVYLESFPVVEEKERRPRGPIAHAPDDWGSASDPFAYFALKERDEALLMGHEPLELPPLATYVPLEADRALRSAAVDECGAASVVAETVAFLPQQELRVPSTLELLPRDAFLRPSAALRPLVRVHAARETLPSFVLRPQRVFRSTPRHWGLALDAGVGTRSLFSLRTGLLRLHDRFRPRTQRTRGPSPLLFVARDAVGKTEDVERDLYRSVWDTSDGFAPPLSVQADDVPCLSDSESDEEDGETKRRVVPTWQDALRLWGDDGDDADEKAEDDEDGAAYERGERYGRRAGVHSFERYRHLIQSERAYNAYRDEKLRQLPVLLHEVASTIEHPDFALVVEGHGPSRPLHEPFAAVFARHQQQQQNGTSP